jgi:A/G-specific adenine glycosylase
MKQDIFSSFPAISASRGAGFSRALLPWYQKNARDLPWRHTRDPYKIWISEIMLQQTTVATVISYYERWIKIFPRLPDVAAAHLSKILTTWQGLGYYQRARNIHKTAKLICKKYNGQFPSDRDVLRSFPGFGPYTTGAVLSIAFDQREPIIDANVRRVVMRFLSLKGEADTKKDRSIYSFLDVVMPFRDMSSFNQALMELGALVCVSGEPLCAVCPMARSCRAYQKKLQNAIPLVRQKSIHKIEAAVAIIKDQGKYYLQKRPSGGLLAGMWEFPGGKIKVLENPREALKRELKEELGVCIRSARCLFTVQHAYTKFRVKLHVFECSVDSLPRQDQTHRWVRPGAFKKIPLPAATVKVIDKLNLLD